MLRNKLAWWFAMGLCAPVAVHAADLGTVGKTYPIAERDAVEELQSRAARRLVDMATGNTGEVHTGKV